MRVDNNGRDFRVLTFVMTHDEVHQVIRRYFDARCSNDRAALEDVLHEDVCFLPPSSMLRPVKGRHEIVRMFTQWPPKTWSAVEHHLRHIIVDGEVAVLVERMVGTTIVGAPYDNDYCFLLTVRDGRIVVIEEFVDSLKASRSLGLLRE